MKKIKDFGSMNNTYEHNFRLEKVENADPSRMDSNEVLIALPGDETYVDAYRKKIAESKYYETHKVRKDAIMAIEVMMTYNGRETNPQFDLQKWEAENLRFLRDTYGEDNVVSAVVHLDEGTPHIHAVVIPMVNDRLNGKHFMDGKASLSQLQTIYAGYMEPLGLERGLKGSSAKHESIQYFYRQLNKEMEKELPSVKEGESPVEYRRRAQAVYQQANIIAFQKTKELSNEVDRYRGLANANAMELDAREKSLEERERKIEDMENKMNSGERQAEQVLALGMKGIEYGLDNVEFAKGETRQRFKQQVYKIRKMGMEEMIKNGVIDREDFGVSEILGSEKEK